MGCSASSALSPSLDVSFHDKYVLGPKLLDGDFSQVHSAIGKLNEKYWVKIVDLRCANRVQQEEILPSTRNELINWRTVGRHNHCAELLASHFENDLCYMVLEPCSSYLFPYLRSMPDITERSLGEVFHAMVSAICHLHSLGLVHRNLTPSSFAVEWPSRVKLVDFTSLADLPCKSEYKPGVTAFMSPEILTGKSPYTEKSDVWALGVIAYLLLFGNFPYMPAGSRLARMKAAIVTGPLPTFQSIDAQSWISDIAKSFVQILLNRDPVQRLTASAALDLPFMLAVTLKSYSYMQDRDLPSLQTVLHHAEKLDEVFSSCSKMERSLQQYAYTMRLEKLFDTLQTSKDGDLAPLHPLSKAKGKEESEKILSNTISKSKIDRTMVCLSPEPKGIRQQLLSANI